MSTATADAFTDAVVAAHDRRAQAGLGETTSAYRLFHGPADGDVDVSIDRLGDFALVRYRDSAWPTDARLSGLASALSAIGLRGAALVFDPPSRLGRSPEECRTTDVDLRARAAGIEAPPTAVIAVEEGRRFELRTDTGFSSGLFFDMRQVRVDLAARWTGRRVLNLFAYTCAFGVALEPHNAVTNVDVSAPALAWGGRNYGLNTLAVRDDSFVRADALRWLEVARKVGNTFDAVVLDPPSFSAGKRLKSKRFSLRTDLAQLIDDALAVLAPDGELLVATNLASLPHDAFARVVRRAAADVDRRVVTSWGPGPDFPVAPRDFHLKTALIA